MTVVATAREPGDHDRSIARDTAYHFRTATRERPPAAEGNVCGEISGTVALQVLLLTYVH